MKKLFSLFMTCIFTVCIVFTFTSCEIQVSDYTVEEHIQRITERVKNSDYTWGFPEGETYQDFAVYPLYNQDDELTKFLIEFEPYGFVLVLAKNALNGLYFRTSMYLVYHPCYGKECPWTPYIANANGPDLSCIVETVTPGARGELILDEKGEVIKYFKSPYYVTGNINEKKYLLKTDNGDIYAVKKDGEFINLVSGVGFAEEEEYDREDHSVLCSHTNKGSEL